MATREFPNRNVNMPMKEADVAAARARLAPPNIPAMMIRPHDGKGSRRQVREGEWIDDRVIIQGGPSSPSTDTPPEIDLKAGPRAIPTFDPTKVYAVTLGKACVFAGRMLAPAKDYTMTGDTCLDPAVTPAIVDAVEIGDIPQDPDITPSMAKSSAAESGEASVDAEATTTKKRR